MLPPAGISSGKFSSNYKEGRISSEHQLLEGWANILMESVQQSFFNKKPQPILALNYKTDLPSATVASANQPTFPSSDEAEHLEAEKLRDASSVRFI